MNVTKMEERKHNSTKIDTLIIAPSILSADISKLESEIRQLEKGGAEWIHIDVMDGHFVPNSTFGPQMVKTIKTITDLTLDVHLMIEKPERYLGDFKKAGADIITVHQETCTHLHGTLKTIRDLGVKAGVSLNPSTSVATIEEVIHDVDLVLIMSVNPGFGGQKFIGSSLVKIQKTHEMLKSKNPDAYLEVDGGIDSFNVEAVVRAGCNVLVAGTGIFVNPDRAKGVLELRNAALRK